MTPGVVILALKVAVVTVTVVLVASLVALALGRPRWHGHLNTAFFLLTVAALIAFEVVIRLIDPDLTAGFSPEQHEALTIHLGFAIPAAVFLPAMLYTGKRKWKTAHLVLAVAFSALWVGTVVTGVFYLPHTFDAVP